MSTKSVHATYLLIILGLAVWILTVFYTNHAPDYVTPPTLSKSLTIHPACYAKQYLLPGK